MRVVPGVCNDVECRLYNLRPNSRADRCGECGWVYDPSQQTCAGSRFGCWTCTVVDVDNSLREMIATGGERYDSQRLGMLADFRDDLMAERNLPENRVQGRNRQGRVLVKRDGSMGVGPYTMAYRADVLERVKALQEEVGQELITTEEVQHIQRIWLEEEANLAVVMHDRLEESA